ncbi:recombinase family protein [Streptomyces olivaceus]|uniref:recombinase family protein n=1 Tax=Streptomyces olivaceus TaxID=47716 RepID=UPI0022EE7A1F|nr:recombinase family protein [Streptomyces olivaceus]GHI91766.1 site-specific recombinase DNA invertase Pin [Streptomyces olivaceus]
MNHPQLAGIYCRLSYAPDGSIEKVERQEEDCRALAARLGWPISDQHIYVDNSKSAWKRDRKRPSWDAMLAAIESGSIDAVVVYHGDRLIRQPWDLEKLIGIADSRGVRIASPSGTRSLDSPDDRFVLRIEAAQACRESDNISRRIQRKIKARAEEGLSQEGGKRPFGYGVPVPGQTRTRVDPDTGEETEVPVIDRTKVVPEEAEILKAAAQRLLAGQSIAGVCRWMNGRCTTTQGGTWNSKNLKALLASPRVAGLVAHDGVLYPASWPEIIERDVWVDLATHFDHSRQLHPYQGSRREYLLSGIAECPTGHRLRQKPSGGRNRKTSRIYYCPDPECETQVGRNMEHLDLYVTGAVLGLLNDPAFRDEVHAEDGGDRIGAEIAALERRKKSTLDQLKQIAEDEELDPAVLAVSVASYDKKITVLRAQMGGSARRRLLMRMIGVDLETWNAEPVDIRSATVEALFRVIVRPTSLRGPGFDPSAVDLLRRRID